jgi:3-oxoadipate enol-lactonase
MDRVTLRGDYPAANHFDGRDRLAHIQTPTLIIGGDADRMIPLADVEELHQQISGSQLAKISGGGHLVALEQPLVVANAIQNWLLEQFP